MANAQEIEAFLNENGAQRDGKTSNRSLYAWMRHETRSLYSQSLQLATEVAKKAERALQHELGKPEIRCIDGRYPGGAEGLLAADRLVGDIKRLELAYLDNNTREPVLVRDVHLSQIAPLALLALRRTGSCTFSLEEALFDLDRPGLYFRRIKSVAMSVPCVVGPSATVSCRLSLLKSTLRRTPTLDGGAYGMQSAEDARFESYHGRFESIITSRAQNDAGGVDPNARDERYLPFENAGVISEWRLDLPANPSKGDPCTFDYDTISDVILHVRYAARDGGDGLKSAAMKHCAEMIQQGKMGGSVRLFSARHDFAAEWQRFRSSTPSTSERAGIRFELRPEHYPIWSRGRRGKVERVDLFARSATTAPATLDAFKNKLRTDTTKVSLSADPSLGRLLVGEATGLLAAPEGEFSVYFDNHAIADLWVAVHWSDR